MKMQVRLVCFCLIFLAQSILAAEVNVHVKMRNSGYTMGDFIEMHVEMTMPEYQSIDTESLPLEGRVKPWLDLHTIKTKIDNNKIYLDFTWQIFATVEIAQTLKLPEVVVKTMPRTSNQKPINIVIPAQSFHYSPVFSYPLGEVSRYPDLPPLRFDEKTPIIYASIFASLGLCCALAWAFLQDYLPWFPRHPGPMTQMARSLKRNVPAKLNTQNLCDIHAALNAVANITLYPQTIHYLFEKAPYLQPYEKVITEFFHASWAQFYDAQSTMQTEIDTNKVLSWIQQSAVSERLFRRKSYSNKDTVENALSIHHLGIKK